MSRGSSIATATLRGLASSDLDLSSAIAWGDRIREVNQFA
jgi:hypothetical protein